MKAQKDSRGVFHPLMVVVIVLVVAVVGFAAWKVSSNKNSSKNSTTSSAAPATASNSAVESACNKELNDKTFCKFASRFTLNSAYKSTINSTDSTGTVTITDFSSDGKGNNSLVTKDASGKETGAFVTLNKATYVKDESTGVWTKYSTAASSTPSATESTPTSDIKLNASDLTANNTTSYKNLGTEKCGGLTCYKYQTVDTANPGNTEYIWFDNKNYQMQRWYSKDSTSGTMDMSFSYQAVNITTPSPVQDFVAPTQ